MAKYTVVSNQKKGIVICMPHVHYIYLFQIDYAFERIFLIIKVDLLTKRRLSLKKIPEKCTFFKCKEGNDISEKNIIDMQHILSQDTERVQC